MFCRKCGQEVDDEAVVCVHCGCATKDEPKKIQDPNLNMSKTGWGVMASLFLGLIGLLIGFMLYPEGTIARKTFIKGWVVTFIVSMVVAVLSYILLIISLV